MSWHSIQNKIDELKAQIEINGHDLVAIIQTLMILERAEERESRLDSTEISVLVRNNLGFNDGEVESVWVKERIKKN